MRPQAVALRRSQRPPIFAAFNDKKTEALGFRFLIYWDFISTHPDHSTVDHAFPESTDLLDRGIRFCWGNLFAK